MLALVDDKWEWNHHDGDWIFQGGPDSSGVLHDVYFNQWDELDSSPQVWAKPFQIDDPMETEPWQLAVNGIY